MCTHIHTDMYREMYIRTYIHAYIHTNIHTNILRHTYGCFGAVTWFRLLLVGCFVCCHLVCCLVGRLLVVHNCAQLCTVVHSCAQLCTRLWLLPRLFATRKMDNSTEEEAMSHTDMTLATYSASRRPISNKTPGELDDGQTLRVLLVSSPMQDTQGYLWLLPCSP